MKKIVLQTESCIGCGACIGIDSEHFEFSDDGFSIIKSQENLDSLALQDAIDACPVAIISLENQESSDSLNNSSAQQEDNSDSSDKHECSSDSCVCEDCKCHEDKKTAA